MTYDRCTCGPARSWDGSENGMCGFCEQRADWDAAGLTDEALQAMADSQPAPDVHLGAVGETQSS